MKSGKRKYVSYRKKALECDRDGTRVEAECYHCSGGILFCTKYKELCHSGACAKERGVNQ